MRRRLIVLLAAVVPLSASLVPMAADASDRDTRCVAVPVHAPPGAQVEAVTAVARDGGLS